MLGVQSRESFPPDLGTHKQGITSRRLSRVPWAVRTVVASVVILCLTASSSRIQVDMRLAQPVISFRDLIFSPTVDISSHREPIQSV